MRQMQGSMTGRGGPMSFGQSKAKLMEGGKVKTTFKDVAGCEESLSRMFKNSLIF